MSLRDDILGSAKIRTADIVAPVWGAMRIQELGLKAMMAVRGALTEAADGSATMELDAEQIASVVAQVIIDDTGQRVFSDDDIPALTSRPTEAMVYVYQKAIELSGSVEESEGN